MSDVTIIADIVLTCRSPITGKAKGIFPPYGLLLLASQMPQTINGCHILTRIWDESTDGYYDPRISKPDLLLISSLTQGMRSTERIAMAAMNTRSHEGNKIKIMIGGVHVTALPFESLFYSNIVVRGEVTLPFQHHLVKRLWKMDPSEKEIWRLTEIPQIIDRPPVDWSLISKENYMLPFGILSCVGCPWDCSFCSVTSTFGCKVRYVTEACLDAELAGIPKGSDVVLYDDNFLPTINRTFVDKSMNIVEKLANAGVKTIAEVSPKTLCLAQDYVKKHDNQNFIQFCADRGVQGFFLGLESVNPNSDLKKTIDIDKSASIIRQCQSSGIGVLGSFVLKPEDLVVGPKNPPYEDQLLDYMINKANLDLMIIGIATPYPGSLDFINAIRNDTLDHQGWDRYNAEYSLVTHPSVSHACLENTLRSIIRSFYGFSSITKRTVAPLFKDWSAWQRFRFGLPVNMIFNAKSRNWERKLDKESASIQDRYDIDPKTIERVRIAISENPTKPKLFDISKADSISNLF